MAAVTQSGAPTRRVIGDLVERFYTVTGVDTNTLTVTQQNIQQVVITPTTAVYVGCTVTGAVNGSVITFAASGAFTAKVGVISREG